MGASRPSSGLAHPLYAPSRGRPLAGARRDFDVIVVGAGTAGLTTAIALASHSGPRSRWRIAVVDRPEPMSLHATELLPVEARSVLERLRLWRVFLAEHHVRVLAQRSSQRAGAGYTYIYAPEQAGWTIDRRWLDEMLMREARLRGIDVWADSRVVSAGPEQVGLVMPDQRAVTVSTRFVVDASGSEARYARHRGARRRILDNLAGSTVVFAVDGPRAPPKAEPWSDGCWYSDQRPHGHLLVSCLTDPDSVAPLGLSALDRWWALLDQTHATRDRVRHAWAESTPVVHSASSHRLEPIVGPDWLAVDETACALHPIASQGILRTISAAERAALTIRDHLEGLGGLTRYAHRVSGEYNRYIRALAGYYAGEQLRWSRRDFWKRRRALV